MKKATKFLIKSRFFILSAICFLIAIVPFLLQNQQKIEKEDIQEVFLSLEKDLDGFAKRSLPKAKQIILGKERITDNRFQLHIFQGDSLVYWSTNKMPISKYIEPQFPNNGRIQLQNGWYYGVVEQDSVYKLCASFPIKTSYSLENEMLSDKVNSDLSQEEFDVGIQEEDKNKIYNNKGEFVFSALNPQKDDKINITKGFFIFNFIGILFLIAGINQKFSLQSSTIIICSLLFLVFLGLNLLQYFSFNYQDFSLINQNKEFFEGHSLFEVIIYAWFISVILQKSLDWIKKINETYVAWIYLILAIFFWMLVLETIHLCVEFSALTMLLKDFFSLKEDILIILIVLGILFYSVNRIFESLARNVVGKSDEKQRRLYILVMILAFLILAILRLVMW